MICPSCGGVYGRDCFNLQECAWITQSINDNNAFGNEVLLPQLQSNLNDAVLHISTLADIIYNNYHLFTDKRAERITVKVEQALEFINTIQPNTRTCEVKQIVMGPHMKNEIDDDLPF